MKNVCHFVLQVKDSAAAGTLISLVDEGGSRPLAWREDRTHYQSCLNIGFTFDGLRALGLKEECSARRKVELKAFVSSAVERAERIGDIGRSDRADG
jgi:hypothetical protein